MAKGYCTLNDVRRALRKAQLPGDIGQDNDIAVDAILSQSRWLDRSLSRHYYAETGDDILSDASTITIWQSTKTRDDEHDIQSQGGVAFGAASDDRFSPESRTVFSTGPSNPEIKERIRLASGDLDDDTIPTYTRIRLARRDAAAINTLNVINADGGYDDWVASNDYAGGVGNSNRGDDYWVRINNGGVSELYLDVHALDDDLPSLSNAVYVDFDYGRKGIPRNVRRAVAFRAAADLVEEAVVEIPENTTLYDIETKAEELREQAMELLGVES
jgi:hypothetical protein